MPGEVPESDTYIISVNFVRVTASQTTRVFNVRKLCRNYQHMMALKHEIERLLCLPNNEQYHDIDKPRNLAKTVTVE
jgi:glucosamine 6-phosphate synthetase-like amidotransferase/phosphosugar isomerase protein